MEHERVVPIASDRPVIRRRPIQRIECDPRDHRSRQMMFTCQFVLEIETTLKLDHASQSVLLERFSFRRVAGLSPTSTGNSVPSLCNPQRVAPHSLHHDAAARSKVRCRTKIRCIDVPSSGEEGDVIKQPAGDRWQGARVRRCLPPRACVTTRLRRPRTAPRA